MVALLDATAVIESHKLGVWGNFAPDWDVAVTPGVREESRYFRTSFGEKVFIDLAESISSGLISVFDPPVVDVVSLMWGMRADYGIELGHGESQCITIVRANPANCAFCTSDRAALRSLGIIGLVTNYVPFAEVFPSIDPAFLAVRYTRAFCNKWVQQGFSERIS